MGIFDRIEAFFALELYLEDLISRLLPQFIKTKTEQLRSNMKKRFVLLTLVLLLAASITAYYHTWPVGAVTWVQGHVTLDTTWASNDTYRVIGDTYIDSGVTLTITPGVRVEFADGFSLKVEGSLNATGTPTEPIVFTSSRTQPVPGAWGDIEFRANNSGHFTLEYSRIEYANNAIMINSPAEELIAQNDFVNNSESGIHIYGDSNATITGNTIIFNKNGITSEEAVVSNVRIVNNTISQNMGEGMFIQASGNNFSRLSDITILNNVISNNSGSGINLNSLARTDDPYTYECNAYIENVLVSENQVTSNGQNGIIVEAEGRCSQYLENVRKGYSYIDNLTLASNIVSSNEGNGIFVHSQGYGFYGESYGNIQNTLITSNNGTENGNNGLEIFSEGVTDGSYASGGGGAIENVTITNDTFSSNSQDGIQLFSKGQADITSVSSISAVEITQNDASSNKGNGISLLANSQGSRGGDASINTTTISGNKAMSNEQNGFLIQPQTREQAYVQDIQFQENEASLNGQNGLMIAPISRRFLTENVEIEKTTSLLNAENGVAFRHFGVQLSNFPVQAYYEGFVVNVTLRNCIISRNGMRGFSVEPDPQFYNSDPTYNRYDNGAIEDLTVDNNTIIANDVGVFICPPVPSPQGQTAEINYNSIRNNHLGLEIVDEHNISAHYNDIFGNDNGMNITDAATADAVNNYWGNDSGPYHYSLNPNGKGNSVDGNGVNLKFIPFLTSPTMPIDLPPTALLSLQNNTVYLNETIEFDASNSTDRTGIRFWSFDFGDGTNTTWTSTSTISHNYTATGTYNVTVSVMNEEGLIGQNSSLVQVQVKAIPEIPLPFILPFFTLVTGLTIALYRKKHFK